VDLRSLIVLRWSIIIPQRTVSGMALPVINRETFLHYGGSGQVIFLFYRIFLTSISFVSVYISVFAISFPACFVV